MDSYTFFLSLGVALGLLVILGYVMVYLFSPGGRKRIEQPKHTMLDGETRLWPKQDGMDK